jgi:ribonuclease R
MEAERASVKVMQIEYMKRHLGDEFDGVIGGVTNFGLFVEITDLLVEGLVRMRDMTDDYYLFDEKHYALRGRSRGRIYRLGDTVRVKVVALDPADRTLDMVLVD